MTYISTSNSYRHIVPIFIHLWDKYGGGEPVTIVGYDKPDCKFTDEIDFHSMGPQVGGADNFGTDLSKFFKSVEDEFVCWMMEDTLIKSDVDWSQYLYALHLLQRDSRIGRVSLTTQNLNQYTEIYPFGELRFGRVLQTPSKSEYRLSTMPAIWNKEYLLRYLKPNMNPWQFECQDKVEDEFLNVALEKPAIYHNEGVRKRNLYEYNLEGIDPVVIQEMKDKGII